MGIDHGDRSWIRHPAITLAVMSRLALLGGGRMGAALVGGLLAGGWDAERVSIAEIDADRRSMLEKEFPHVRVVPSAAWAVADADVVVVAVKPGDVAATLETALAALGETTLVLSIAAGVTIDALEAMVPGRPVVRAMPNTPALVGAAASAIAPGAAADAHHLELAEQVLGAVGVVVRVAEPALDSVTGLSGSGPAYVFLMAEALIDAGVAQGLTRPVATRLVVQTLLGSALLLDRDEEGIEAHGLRAAVTSPGGTTAAGLRELELHGFRAAVIEAVAAATERSRELGQG